MPASLRSPRPSSSPAKRVPKAERREYLGRAVGQAPCWQIAGMQPEQASECVGVGAGGRAKAGPNAASSELRVALRGALGALLVAVGAARDSPAVVVVVVEREQVFEAEISRVDAVCVTQVALELLCSGRPVAVHVPARA